MRTAPPDFDSISILLSRTAVWYGAHSGYYEQLPRALAEAGAQVKVIAPRDCLWHRIPGKLWALWHHFPRRNQSRTIAELRFHRAWRSRPTDIGFIAAIEDHLPCLSYWPKTPRRLIGALHFPAAYWGQDRLAYLRHLDSAVVLYRADIAFFEQFVGAGRVKFVYHGVDTEFFKPPVTHEKPTLRAVFCGQFGRDFEMLEQVTLTLLDRFPSLHFDLIIPRHADGVPALAPLASHPRVVWHNAITDEALRGVYHNASLMLLPMKACGANNAVVEALACGLPILSTDVGGMRDYGGGTLFPVVPAGDAEAMLGEATRLLTEDGLLADIGRRSREFAESVLAWPVVAREHLRVMHELADAP